MRRKIFLAVIALGIIFLELASAPPQKDGLGKQREDELLKAFKATGVPRTINLSITGDQDYVGKGLFNEHTGWILIPKDIQIIGDPKLVFYLSYSNTLSPTSTLTVSMNDQPLYSMNMLKDKSRKKPVEVIVPRSVLKGGQNSISFQFYNIQDLTNPCKDLDNPAAWSVIHRDSTLELTYQNRSIESLNLFPDPFLKMERFEKRKSQLVIALPQNPTTEELKAAIILVQYFGYLDPFMYVSIQTFMSEASPDAVLKNSNIISIGDLNRNPFVRELKSRVPVDILNKLDQEKGIIAMIKSPFKDERVAVIVSGKVEKTLFKSAEVLTFPMLVQKIEGAYAIVDTSQDLPQRKSVADINNPSFSDLGYFNTKLAGTYESTANFEYQIPPHWQLQHGAALSIDASYSPLLNPEKSIMTVLINDKPIESIKLSGGGGHARWHFQIPDELLNEKAFYVTVRVYLDVNQTDCESRYYDRAWIIINDQSSFSLPHKLAADTGFQNFPATFYGESGLDFIKIVIPDKPTVKDYNCAFDMVYLFSSLMPYNVKLQFEILKASEITEKDLTTFDLVMIGSLKNNTLLAKANSRLPLPLDPDTGQPRQAVMKILPEFLSNVAVIELSRSFWNPKNSMMTVMAANDSLLKLATQNLLKRAVLSEWEGNIVLVNDKDQWYSYEKSKKGKTEGKQKKLPLQLFLWLLIVLTTAGALAFLLYRRNKYGFRDPFEEP
ncbi:MAG: cellulose biosynthesis cyclic di-GMP-binding regulatory protein BcsB [Candidatus Omnitrophica bacterium]|nr:cellulose biosynthesis cyclic di-GMP-binding regulatory protein BcsB [Candidatus Omnitrophota bacterium]